MLGKIMKQLSVKKLLILLSALGIQSFSNAVQADYPRLFAWGLTGSEQIGRVDIMQPFTTLIAIVYFMVTCNQRWEMIMLGMLV